MTDGRTPAVGRARHAARFAAILGAAIAMVLAVALLTSAYEPPPPEPYAYVGPQTASSLNSSLDSPKPRKPEPEPEPKPEPEPAPAPKPEPEPEPKRLVIDRNAADPVRVEVPSVDISAHVGSLGLTQAGALDTPDDFSKAGWWAAGPEPGERGPAVITAHVDSQAGPAAFYTLADASPGDEVLVERADGSSATFVIDSMGQYPKDDFPTQRVYDKTPKPELRLITCGGVFDESTGHYKDNIIAYARRARS